jgi:hypothetical protein
MNKKMSRVMGVCMALVAVLVFSGCGKSAKIDYRMNVVSQDTGNFFQWTAGGASVNDTLDAASSASKLNSTVRFDQAVTYDIPANAPKHQGYTIPVGFRSVLLYPVAPDSFRTDDDLTVTPNNKEVTIRYIHRDSAYEIKTDANGKLDVSKGCKVAQGIATTEDQHTFTLKPEFVKAGGNAAKMADFDWSKASLTPDVYNSGATRHYTGIVDVAFNGTILTIKGTLKEAK